MVIRADRGRTAFAETRHALQPADVYPDPCGNGTVNIDDLMLVINNWGTCPGSFVSSPEIPQWILDCLENCGEDPGCLIECIEEGLKEN